MSGFSSPVTGCRFLAAAPGPRQPVRLVSIYKTLQLSSFVIYYVHKIDLIHIFSLMQACFRKQKLADHPLNLKIILNNGCDVIAKIEMLDLPALVEVLDFQMMIVDDLVNPAF